MLLSEIIQFIKQTHSKKSSEPYHLSDLALSEYMGWALSQDYLFLESDENGLNGLLVVYPLKNPCNNLISSILPSNENVPKNEESKKDLVFMDCIFKTTKARKSITQKFMKRYSNWRNQRKLALRKHNLVLLKNKYIELTGGLN